MIRVRIDPDKCRGHALCLTRAPDGFEFLDLEDRAVVIESAVGTVPDERFIEAARECPERAIIVEYEDASSPVA